MLLTAWLFPCYFFLSVALGLGGTNTPQTKFRKSISSERTFSDTNDEALLYKKLVDLAEMLSSDMKREGLCGKTLTLKLKTTSFEVRTRAVTLPDYISSSDDILKHASKLLKAELPASFRLIGTDFPTDRHDTLPELSDSAGDNQVSDFNNGDCLLVHNDVDAEVNDPGRGEQLIKPYDNGDLLLVEKPSFPEEFEGNSWDKLKNGVGLENLQAGCSLNQKGLFYWVEDYKCSLCGVELPHCFIEERQEHSDFHLAEKLQEEESGVRHKNFMPKQRNNRHEPRKKQKSSLKDSKHVPIDRYFSKATQNF